MNRDRVIIVAIICMTIIFIASTVSPAGSSGKTGAGFQMETVKTGDVTWACLKHNCWNISSVFIVITLGVIAILCVIMLLGVFVCIFDHDDKNDKSSKE